MESAYFRVDHADIIPREIGRSEQALRALVGAEHEDFTLVVMRRCHFQIELSDPSEADEFEIHDLHGNVLQLSEFEGNGRRDGYRFGLPDGRTNMLAVGDAAGSAGEFVGTGRFWPEAYDRLIARWVEARRDALDTTTD